MPDAASSPLETITHFVSSTTSQVGVIIKSMPLRHREPVNMAHSTQLVNGRADVSGPCL